MALIRLRLIDRDELGQLWVLAYHVVVALWVKCQCDRPAQATRQAAHVLLDQARRVRDGRRVHDQAWSLWLMYNTGDMVPRHHAGNGGK